MVPLLGAGQQRYAARKGVDWTGYVEVIGFIDVGLNGFYVYELSGEDFYLHASYYGELEVEMELEESHTLSRRIEVEVKAVEVFLEMECKVHNRKIEDLKLESWDFA